MSTHEDQLKEWWEKAEKGSPDVGDLIIIDAGDGAYVIERASIHWEEDEQYNDTRIIERAPETRPSWYDAPAVNATYRDELGTVTGLWRPILRPGAERIWEGLEGELVSWQGLENVVPLMEAKVTDEMIDRYITAIYGPNWTDVQAARSRARAILSVVLDPEGES